MEQKPNPQYVVTAEFLQILLNYLIQRPYTEVHQLVGHIRTLKPMQTNTETTEEKK